MLTDIFAYITAGAVAVSALSGCGISDTAQTEAQAAVQTVSTQTSAQMYAQFAAEYSNRDCDASYDEASAVKIVLTGNSAQISGSGALADGGKVTISAGGTYIVSGTLSGGSVIIDAPETEKVQLVLSGADITSADGPAVYEKQCDKLFVTLVGENKLADSAQYTLDEGEDEPNAAMFAKHDMTINGSGSLEVNGVYKHGIFSKDDLKITDGIITVSSAADGIRGRDSVYIKNGTVTINAGGDGIQSNNDTAEDKGRISVDGGTVNITAENDGIQAESVLQINGGVINIKSGDEENAPAQKGNDFGGKGGMGGGMRPDGGNGGKQRGGMTQDANVHLPPDGMMQNGDRSTPPDGMMQNGDITITPDSMTQNSDRPTPPDNMMQSGEQNVQQNTTEENTESKKGLKSGNALYVNGGTITVSAEDDAVHSDVGVEINDGNLTLSTADDAVHAEYACTVNGGSIKAVKCYEGLEGKTVTVNGGNVDITASDDGINASNPTVSNAQPGRGSDDVYIEINGGTVNVVSQSDSFDSNGNLFIKGGSVTLDGPSMSMDCAIDCDGKAYVYGGTVAASGAANGSMSFDASSEQASLMVIFTSQQAAGTAAVIYDTDGKEIARVTPTKSYSGVVFSSPEMKKGERYTVKAGDVSVTAELTDMSVVVTDTGAAVSTGMNGMGGGMHGGRGR